MKTIANGNLKLCVRCGRRCEVSGFDVHEVCLACRTNPESAALVSEMTYEQYLRDDPDIIGHDTFEIWQKSPEGEPQFIESLWTENADHAQKALENCQDEYPGAYLRFREKGKGYMDF